VPTSRGLVATGLDQIWAADITYVRLAGQFVYLRGSRRLLAQDRGWALADHLEASLAIEASHGLGARNPRPADPSLGRGVHMRAPPTPIDWRRGLTRQHEPRRQSLRQAKAERFMRTLKDEEVNGKTYASLQTPQSIAPSSKPSITRPLHSALDINPG